MQTLEIICMLAGVGLLVAVALLGKRQKDDREQRLPDQRQPDLSPEGSAKLQTSLMELLRELHTLSNDMTVDLDQKLTELKEVLQQADNKLEEIASAGGEEEPAEENESPLGIEAADPTDGYESEPPEAHDDDAAAPTGRYKEIYQMEDEGLPIEEIARRLSMGKGEIQLILSLREKD